ncbi:GbsR/MarR family transcriptional regulator [Thermococcus sp.]
MVPVESKRKRFTEIVEKLLLRWGYSSTDGRVYATLLAEGRPMTISEISDELGLSRSAISISLSRLSRDYLVTYRRLGRTKYFSAVPAFLEGFMKQPRVMLEREIVPLEEIVESMVSSVNDPERRKHLQGLLQNLKNLECVLRKIIEVEERADCT